MVCMTTQNWFSRFKATVNFIFDFFNSVVETVSDEEIEAIFANSDIDASGCISFEEFVDVCYYIVTVGQKTPPTKGSKEGKISHEYAVAASSGMQGALTGAEEEDHEEEEKPEDIASLPAEEQEAAVKRKAFTMLAFGTAAVLIFSGENYLLRLLAFNFKLTSNTIY